MSILYPDQQRLLTELRDSMASGNRSVLVQAATGFGKTILASQLIHGSRNKGTISMMTVPRIELVNQSERTFDGDGISFSHCSAGQAMNPESRTFLATNGTLLNRIKKDRAPKINMLVVDETHYGGEGLDQIISYYRASGAWIIGLSATPARLDGKGLDCWYDAMVCGPSIAWLIQNKRLSDYRLFAPSTPDLGGIKTVGGDYAKGELAARMEADRKNVGNAVAHYKQHAMGKLNVVYTVSREHSGIICQMANDAGIPAATIDGTNDAFERARIVKAFARRELLWLINCELLTFGFDLSAASGMDVCVESISDLRPTQSLALQMQKWGRGLRKKDFPALFFDHAGNAMRHGLPDDEREWTLDGRTKREQEESAKAKPNMQCDGGYPNRDMTGDRMKPCYMTHRPAPRCPNCHAWYKVESRLVEEVDGELTEMKRPVLREPTLDDLQKIKKMVEGAVRKGTPQWRAMKWAREKILSGEAR